MGTSSPWVLALPIFQGPKHNFARLTGDPGEAHRGPRASLPSPGRTIHTKPISRSLPQHGSTETRGRRIYSLNKLQPTIKEKNNQTKQTPKHQSRALAVLYRHSPLHRALQENARGAMSSRKMKVGKHQLSPTELGLVCPCTPKPSDRDPPLLLLSNLRNETKKTKPRTGGFLLETSWPHFSSLLGHGNL